MRKIAFTGVLTAVVLAVAPASANDFSALTSTDYNAQPTVNQYAQVQHTAPVGCASGNCATGPAMAAGVCDGCSDGSCGNASCGKGGVCIPHVTPNLPNSSLRQYWRSSACNTGVWDGYRKECCSGSKHTRGECDCFSGKKKKFGGCLGNCGGSCGDPGCAPTVVPVAPDCTSGGCDVNVVAPAVEFTGQVGCDAPAYATEPAPCDSPGGCDSASAWAF